MQKKPEEQLREYANTLGCSMRDLRNLVMQTFIEDENFQKRQYEAMQHQVNMKQMKLLDIETSVKGMEYTILQRKLTRILWRQAMVSKIKSFFKPKKNADTKRTE